MKCMAFIALVMIIVVHMLKVGLLVFLLFVACGAENSIAHEHDHQEIDDKKSKHLHNKSTLTQ